MISAILFLRGWRKLERLSALRDLGCDRRLDRVLAGEFDGAFAHFRSPASYQPERWLLEDVHHLDPAGRDSLRPAIFPPTDCKVFVHLPQRRKRRPYCAYAPSG